MEAEPFPRRISVELTNHCNQRCVLCPRLGFTRPLGFMDRDVFERVARECAAHSTRLWLHFLGEPLLHRGVVSMIRFAKSVGVQEVGLSTNGVSLRGRLGEEILAAGLDRLECSIDADDAEGYLAMRGRDHFVQVTANVRAFLERKRALGLERPVTSIQVMRTPRAEAILSPLVESWREYLGPRDFVMTIVPASFAGAIDVPADSAAQPGSPAGVGAQPGSPAGVAAPEEARSDVGPRAAVLAAGAAARVPCRWLFTSVMVLQDGTVTMCGADWDARAPLGNVRDRSIAEIWQGAEILRRRQAHLDGRYDAVPICGGCEDWRLSDGHGYSNVLAATGPADARGS